MNTKNTITPGIQYSALGDAHLQSVLEQIKQKAVDTLMEGYNKNQTITINDKESFNYFLELVQNNQIRLENIQSIILAPNNNYTIDEQTHSINDLLDYVKSNENQFTNLTDLKLLRNYQGQLTISTLNFELKNLELGNVFNLTVDSQPKLSSLTIAKVEFLEIKKQNCLEELSIYCVCQKCTLDIQPRLKTLNIKVCHTELSLQDQPSLETLNIERVWSGLLIVTKEQRALLNHNPCVEPIRLMIEKPTAELQKSVPMGRLLTLGHLRSLIRVNGSTFITAFLTVANRSVFLNGLTNTLNYIPGITSIANQAFVQQLLQTGSEQVGSFYANNIAPIAAAQTIVEVSKTLISLASESLASPTLVYVMLTLLALHIIYDSFNEMQRIYKNEKAMMYLDI